jgi:hypothetical protein
VCSKLLYSCLLLRICNMYADTGLFVFMYRMYSWCLIVIDLSICPTYDLLHVLHCSPHIPQEIALFCGTLSCICLYMVLLVRKAIFMLECLRKFVTLRISGLRNVNVTHVFCCMFVTVLSVFCFFFRTYKGDNKSKLFST